jgi:hypothetical protein
MSQTYKGVFEFVFPGHIEHPDTTGRLEVLAYLGPVTPEGKLLGGYLGRHELQDLEITGMILQQVTDTAKKIIGPGKEAVVAEAVKKSYTTARISKDKLIDVLKNVPIFDSGCLDFRRLQKTVLEMHHARISEICDQLSSKSLNQGVVENKVIYRHAPTVQYQRKMKKIGKIDPLFKKLHKGVFSITGIDETAETESMRANIKLIRPVGNYADKWDRSCATRKTGHGSYVGGRGPIENHFDGCL